MRRYCHVHTWIDIDVELVIVIEFPDGMMATEPIYWDHAVVLWRIGKL